MANTNLLSYQGNAALGLGSNADIPAVGTTDLSIINNAARDIFLTDNQKNLVKYQQKISDRDHLQKLILAGQIPAGNMLKEYLPEFQKAKDASLEAFRKWKGNFNDTDGYMDYVEKVSALNDAATKGHSNTLELAKMEQEKAASVLPSEQKAIQDHIDKMKAQGLWGDILPFQKLHDVNAATFDSFVRPFKGATITPNPKEPYKTIDTTYIDYGDILGRARTEFLKGQEGSLDIQQWLQKHQQYDQKELPKVVDAIDRQLTKYNQERGLKAGQPGYADPIKKDFVNGNLMLKEPAVDFAAKWALAKNQQFVTKTPVIDSKLGTIELGKQRVSIERMRAGTDAMYKRGLLAAQNKKIEGYNQYLKDKLKGETPEGQTQALDELYTKNLLGQNSLITGRGSGKFALSNIIADQSLPMFRLEGKVPSLLKPIGSKPIFSDSDEEGKGGTQEKKNIIGYKGGHYEVDYMQGGRKLSTEQVAEAYRNFKKDPNSQGWQGGLEDFIRTAVERGLFDFTVKGENGSTNRLMSRAAQMAISNLDTKKGQTGLFNPLPDEVSAPDQTTEPQTQEY